MDIALPPFAAGVLAGSFRDGQGNAPPSPCTASRSSFELGFLAGTDAGQVHLMGAGRSSP